MGNGLVWQEVLTLYTFYRSEESGTYSPFSSVETRTSTVPICSMLLTLVSSIVWLESLRLLVHTWKGGSASVFPTAEPAQVTLATTNIMSMRAIVAEYGAVASSLAPSSTSLVLFSTNSNSLQSPPTLTTASSVAPSSGRLTNGEKAGIGVGVSIGVTALLVAIVFVLAVLKRNRQIKRALRNMERIDKPELEGIPIERHQSPVEMDGTGGYWEKDGEEVLGEVDSGKLGQAAHEIPDKNCPVEVIGDKS